MVETGNEGNGETETETETETGAEERNKMISNHWKKCMACADHLLGDPSMDIRDRKVPKTIYHKDAIACEDCGGPLVDIYNIWKYCDKCLNTWPHIYETCPKCNIKTRWLPVLEEAPAK